MEIFREASELKRQNIPFAMATIISSTGSTPRSSAKMIILSENRTIGTIGGGLAESYVTKEAAECLSRGESKTVEYALDSGSGTNSIGMICGGSMKIFIEVVTPRPELLIIGGGHVALQIASLAGTLDYRVFIAENRKEFVSEERFPMADSFFYSERIEDAVSKTEIKKNTYIIICTGSVDEEALRTVINSDAAYIGLLGSRRKAAVIIRNLKKEGLDRTRLESVYTPVGLDLNAETPEEIALSIMAEIQMVRTGAPGQPISRKYGDLVIVRGGGDIASGSIARLYNAGFKVVVLEIKEPTHIRSAVSYAQAMYDGSVTVDGITAVKANNMDDIYAALADNVIPVTEDPEGKLIRALKPAALVDAILAKKNLGTETGMAPVVIGLGPGFEAGLDVDAVIETNRGHNLGRVILKGKPEPNTGVPGVIGGEAEKRVVRATADGKISVKRKIGDLVKEGDLLAVIGDSEVRSQLKGVLRGIIRDGMAVTEGFKIGDVDTRGNVENCFTISDKARAVGGGTLEALLRLRKPKRK